MRKVTLVTGASGGIGLELARAFSAGGDDLAITARSEDALSRLADEIEQAGRLRPIVIALDLAEPGAADRIIAAVAREGARVRRLVNNAGFGLNGDAADLPRAEQVAMIDLNVRALTDLTFALLPDVIGEKGGVLNVASTAAFQPGPGMAVYYATKAFVLSFSEALAYELAPRGVTVTALCPGPTSSGFQARAQLDSALFDVIKPMSAAEVARYGREAFLRGDRVAVPGLMNRVMAGAAGPDPAGAFAGRDLAPASQAAGRRVIAGAAAQISPVSKKRSTLSSQRRRVDAARRPARRRSGRCCGSARRVAQQRDDRARLAARRHLGDRWAAAQNSCPSSRRTTGRCAATARARPRCWPASGTAIGAVDQFGMKEGSQRGRPMPSMQRGRPERVRTLRSARWRWNTDPSGSARQSRVGSRR